MLSLQTAQVFAVLFLWTTTCNSQQNSTILTITDAPPMCEPLTVPFCSTMGYTHTLLPNARGYTNQTDAFNELSDFFPLLDTNCSNVFPSFLCFYYFPTCITQDNGPISFKTCRNLCEHVRSRCESEFTLLLSLSWPSHLDCSLDSFSAEIPCLGPDDPSSLEDDESTTAPPPTTSDEETEEPTSDSQPTNQNTVTRDLGTGGAGVINPSLPLTLLVVSVLIINSFLKYGYL